MAGEFQLIGYLRLLAEHGVEYLIVGGVGSRLQGAATTTQDIDIMPDPAPENLERLAHALSHLGTEKKESQSTKYEPHDDVTAVEFQTSNISSYLTIYGAIDVLMELPGVGVFDAVRANARRYGWEDGVILVADIDDIITSKQNADRAKDWRAMDALYEARGRLRDHPDVFELSDGALDVEAPIDRDANGD